MERPILDEIRWNSFYKAKTQLV